MLHPRFRIRGEAIENTEFEFRQTRLNARVHAGRQPKSLCFEYL